jgi:RNA polymerase sigma-B factor
MAMTTESTNSARQEAQTNPNDLVQSHIGLARSLSRRFQGRGEPPEDLEQVALLALVGAAHRFDPGRDVSFSTFATVSVLGELKRHFRDRGWWVRLPRRVHDTYLAIGEAREALAQRIGRSPTVQDIAAHLEIDEEQVLEAMEAGGGYRPASLDKPRHPDAPAPIEELSSSSGDEYEAVLDRHRLRELLPGLEWHEQTALKGYYFDDRTQADIGRELGVSQMQVSRILSSVARRLRTQL